MTGKKTPISGILLGIDLGTTVLKLCAFDRRDGALLAHTARRLRVVATPDGGREQHPDAIDRSFKTVVGEVRAALGAKWRRIEGVGLAAQGGSSIVADRETGKALTPMILWNDGRTHAHLEIVRQEAPEDYWRHHVLQPGPPEGLGRLRWLHEIRSELFYEGNIHVGAGEYLFFKLTDVWRQDAGNAIQIGSYNAVRETLCDDPFRYSNLPLSFVAPLREGHRPARLSNRGAELLDLPAGTPVAGPYIDQEAGYLSAAALGGRPLHVSLGTAWVGNFVLPETAEPSAGLQLIIPSPAEPGRLAIVPILSGNLTWDWALRTCLSPNPAKALLKAEGLFARRLLPSDGLFLLPGFTQPHPLCGATGAGLLLGLNAEVGREDIVRAAASGLAFDFMRILEDAKRTEIVDRVVLSGGASQGAHFRELFAGLFDPLPVLWERDGDLAVPRGALHAFHPRTAVPPQVVPAPASREAIRERFESYKRIAEKLAGAWPLPAPFKLTLAKGPRK